MPTSWAALVKSLWLIKLFETLGIVNIRIFHLQRRNDSCITIIEIWNQSTGNWNTRIQIEILMAVGLKNTIFWNITPCILIEIYGCFVGPYGIIAQKIVIFTEYTYFPNAFFFFDLSPPLVMMVVFCRYKPIADRDSYRSIANCFAGKIIGLQLGHLLCYHFLYFEVGSR
jgi:hypothetical protein